MITRRSLIRGSVGLGGAAALALGASGCARPVGAARDPKHIELWGMGAADAAKEKKIVDAFLAKNPGVTINVSQVPSNGAGDASSVITAVRGGTAPDIWFMDRFSGAQYAALGLLEPIDDLITKYEATSPAEFAKQWLPFAMAELAYSEKYYGLPMQTDTRGMFYNKALLGEAGLTEDELNPANNSPLTIDRIWEVIGKFDKVDARGNYERVAFLPFDSQGSVLMWAMMYGVGFFDNQNCTMTLDTPAMVKVLNTYAGWIRKLNFPRLQAFKSTYEPPNHPPSQSSFFSGRQLFQISGPWEVQGMRKYKPDLKWGTTYLPVAKEGDKPFTWAGGFSVVMPKGSSMSKAAWDFLKFYAGYEGQSIIMKAITGLPTNVKCLENPNTWDQSLKFFGDLLPNAYSRPPLPVGQLLWDTLFEIQDSLNQGSKTGQEAASYAQKRVESAMQLYCPFKLPADFKEPGQK